MQATRLRLIRLGCRETCYLRRACDYPRISVLIHFYDFWVHEMTVKYIDGDMSGLIDPNNAESGFRYYEELTRKVCQPNQSRYLCCGVCILLALHLYCTDSIQSFQVDRG